MPICLQISKLQSLFCWHSAAQHIFCEAGDALTHYLFQRIRSVCRCGTWGHGSVVAMEVLHGCTWSLRLFPHLNHSMKYSSIPTPSTWTWSVGWLEDLQYTGDVPRAQGRSIFPLLSRVTHPQSANAPITKVSWSSKGLCFVAMPELSFLFFWREAASVYRR